MKVKKGSFAAIVSFHILSIFTNFRYFNQEMIFFVSENSYKEQYILMLLIHKINLKKVLNFIIK